MRHLEKKRVKVPTVLQMEAVECGAASLAMILRYYEKYIPLEKLRSSCGVSRDGSKAGNIVKAARLYGLMAKGYKTEPEGLRKIKLPAIIHWNFNHFIVLEGFKKDKVFLNDPAVGKRVLDSKEFDQGFTGIVLTFEKSDNFKKSGQKPTLYHAIQKRVVGSKWEILYIVIIGIMISLTGLIVPTFSKVFVDEIMLGNKQNWVIPLICGMGLTAVIRGFLVVIQSYYLLKLETKIALRSSAQFLWHMLRLPIEFFMQRYNGDISSRMQSNEQVARVLSQEIAVAGINFVMIIFYFAIMMHYDVVLSCVGVVAVAFNIICLKAISEKRKDASRKLLQDRGKWMGISMSGLQMIETLKATGAESNIFARWAGYQAKVVNAEQNIGLYSSILLGASQFFAMITNVIVLILGGYRVLEGHMTVGMLVAFQSLMISFLQPVSEIINLGGVFQEMEGNMGRLDDVMKYPIDPQTESVCTLEKLTERKQKLEGHIEVRDLSFGYGVLESPFIENFHLSIKPGQKVALIGGSGSGKSTIAKLLSGLYLPWSGQIYFDHEKKSSIPRPVVNHSLSVVDQDICLFEGSIKQNITLWNDAITDIEIIQAAKDACIHQDITCRSGGYEHQIREGGSNLSGGQRQRIEIARALAINPSILIMDEATSALDPITEKIIVDQIKERGCTCIIVAHRLSTIRDCDEIIVLDKGKIIQRGTHDELMQQGGYYTELIQAT